MSGGIHEIDCKFSDMSIVLYGIRRRILVIFLQYQEFSKKKNSRILGADWTRVEHGPTVKKVADFDIAWPPVTTNSKYKFIKKRTMTLYRAAQVESIFSPYSSHGSSITRKFIRSNLERAGLVTFKSLLAS